MEKIITEEKLRKLASFLHKKYCCYNHADYCWWYYEFHNKLEEWEGTAHSRWLAEARNIIKIVKELHEEND